jgi:pantoate--beta-alanine ligase
MRTIRTVAELRTALTTHRRAGRTIGLVPTMGAFHEGHLSLMRKAREDNDVIVVSLFVNPTQFNESSDLERYPRDEARDAQLAIDHGVDYLFAPEAQEVYPPGFATTVAVHGLTEPLEGAHRGTGHFDGVTTVVTKLFNMVGPDAAYFGQKDAQQAVVIKRMVRDLDIPVRVEICPTVRESDGLAMSSRNALLDPRDRRRAAALSKALQAIEAAVAGGERDAKSALAAATTPLEQADIDPEYLELVSMDTMAPVQRIDGDVLAVIAARLGNTRLIDNQRLSTARAAGSQNNGRP